MDRIIRVVALLASGAFLTIPPQPSFANPHGCPPGLAKKNPPCVPPGQAKKPLTTGQSTGWDRIGQVADRDKVFYLDDYSRYDLPPVMIGERYAVVDGRIVVIDAESFQILQWIRLFTALAD